jgi:hypothetical protein
MLGLDESGVGEAETGRAWQVWWDVSGSRMDR